MVSANSVLVFSLGLTVGLLVNVSVFNSYGAAGLQVPVKPCNCEPCNCEPCNCLPCNCLPCVCTESPQASVPKTPKIGRGLYWFGGDIKNLLLHDDLPKHLKSLPIVDVGVHDGSDFTLPAARAGHKVYAYEPTGVKYKKILKTLQSNDIPFTDDLTAFRRPEAKGVLLRRNVACSGHSGSAMFTTSTHGGGVVNSLYSGALPKADIAKSVRENVTLVTLSEDLKEEKDGLLLLKMDCQGCEYHGLLGARDYIKSHKVYVIFLEFFSKGLQAADKQAPERLLDLLTIDLGYQCFDARSPKHSKEHVVSGPLSLKDFAAKYHFDERLTKKYGGYGRFTDLLCTKFDLL